MKRWIRLAMLVILMLALGSFSAFAASFTVELSNQRLNLISDTGSVQSFFVSGDTLTVGAREDGSLTLTFQESGRTTGTCAAFTQVRQLNLTGTIGSLTLGSSLTSQHSITISGTVSTLIVSGAPQVSFASGCSVGQLTSQNSAASFFRSSGAYIRNSNISLSSGSYSSSSWDSVDNWDNWDNSSSNSSRYTYTAPSYYDSRTYVSPLVDNTGDFTRDNYFDASSSLLSLSARSYGVTLAQAISDISLPVYRTVDGSRVNGSWRWTDANSTETTSGTYHYCFTPSDSRLDSITLTVRFTARSLSSYRSYSSSSSRSNWDNNWDWDWDDRRNDRWEDDWNRWGGWNNAPSRSYTRTIQVQIPSYVSYGYQVELYNGNSRIATYPLSPSDAGTTKRYTVTTSSPSSITASVVRR